MEDPIVVNYSEKTDEIFKEMESEIERMVGEIIDHTRTSFNDDFIENMNLDTGINETICFIQTWIERIKIHIFLFLIDNINKITTTIVNGEKAKISEARITLERQEKELFEKSSGKSVDHKQPVAEHARKVKSLREIRIEFMYQMNETIRNINEKVPEKIKRELKRLEIKFTNKVNLYLSGKHIIDLNTVAKTIVSKALNTLVESRIVVMAYIDIAKDIFNLVKQLKENTIHTPVETQSAEQNVQYQRQADEEQKKEKILNNRMLFYKHMGWCNYKLDIAIREVYKDLIVGDDSNINNYNTRKFLEKSMLYMNRDIFLHLPTQHTDDVPGPPRDSSPNMPLGLDERKIEMDELQRMIDNELAQQRAEPTMPHGPSLIRLDHNFRKVEIPLGASDDDDKSPCTQPPGNVSSTNQTSAAEFGTKLLPTLERLIDLHFK